MSVKLVRPMESRFDSSELTKSSSWAKATSAKIAQTARADIMKERDMASISLTGRRGRGKLGPNFLSQQFKNRKDPQVPNTGGLQRYCPGLARHHNEVPGCTGYRGCPFEYKDSQVDIGISRPLLEH